MIETNGSKPISTYWSHIRLMNPKIVSFSGMTIAAVALFFASGHMIGNQQAIAFGGHGFGPGLGHYYGPGIGHYYGPGIGHYYGPGLGHYYGPGLGHYYGPGYPLDNPCGGGPYSIINGQIVCTTG
ncbi:MAG: hypothetical protein WAK17_06005 [Candidatus Nitrosopolaris sp.]